MKHKREENLKPKQALQEAIGFTVDDLEMNDNGFMSPAQLKMLKQDFARWFLFNLAITAIYLLAYNGFQSGPKTYNDIGSLILFSLLLSPFFLLTLNNWLRLMIDWLNGNVANVEGSIALDVISNRGNTR